MNQLTALTIEERKQLFWFFVLAFFILATGYGLREPWPSDEPRFVLVAKQMVESGNYLFPHRGIELYPDKPPVFFWILAAFYHVIGSWRWSFLLPSMLSGLGVLYLAYDAARRLWNPRAGLWAAACILFCIQFVYQFKRAQIDPVLVLFTTLALYGLIRHLLLGPHWRWFYAACFFAGLGVITKGVGFLPLLIFLPYIFLRSTQASGLADLGRNNFFHWSAGLLFFAFAIALWLAPVLWVANHSGVAEQQVYLNDILFRQTAERYANPWGHHEPFWYFAEIIALFWLPFSIAFLWLWKPWWQALRIKDGKVLLPLLWAVLVIVFFSISSGKRDMYILPALPAVAIAAASFMQYLSEQKSFRIGLFLTLALISGILCLLGLYGLISEPGFEKKLLLERGMATLETLWWMLIATGGGAFLFALIWHYKKPMHSSIVLFVLLWSGYGFIAYPFLDAANSSKDIMARARQLAGAEAVIGLVDWKEQNLLQAQGATTDFGFLQPPLQQLSSGVHWLRQAPLHRKLLVQATPQMTCIDFKHEQAQPLGNANRRSWWLISEKALVNCQ